MRLRRSFDQFLRSRRGAGAAMRVEPRRSPLLDCLMIASGAGFFVVAILYVVACEKM